VNAFTKTSYGRPEVLKLEEVDKPALKEDCLLVKVMAKFCEPGRLACDARHSGAGALCLRFV